MDTVCTAAPRTVHRSKILPFANILQFSWPFFKLCMCISLPCLALMSSCPLPIVFAASALIRYLSHPSQRGRIEQSHHANYIRNASTTPSANTRKRRRASPVVSHAFGVHWYVFYSAYFQRLGQCSLSRP